MFALKCLAITCFFAQVAYNKEVPDSIMQVWNALIAPYDDDCKMKTIPKPEDVVTMYTAGYVPENKALSCYMNCLYEKLKLFNADGDVDIEHMMNIAPYMTLDVSQKCAKVANPETNVCRKSFLLTDCAIKINSV